MMTPLSAALCRLRAAAQTSTVSIGISFDAPEAVELWEYLRMLELAAIAGDPEIWASAKRLVQKREATSE